MRKLNHPEPSDLLPVVISLVFGIFSCSVLDLHIYGFGVPKVFFTFMFGFTVAAVFYIL